MGKSRVLKWCGETAASMKKGLDKIPMAKAGRQAGNWLWGGKKHG